MPVLRPLMTPTTPVLPMPGTISSQPNAASLSATMPAVRCRSKPISGMLVQVLAPRGNFVLHGRDTIDDWHELASGVRYADVR